MPRPNNAIDRVVDFGLSGTQYASVGISINPSIYAYNYKLYMSGSAFVNPPQTIDLSGSVTTNYTIFNSTGATFLPAVRRPLTSPGKYTDQVITYVKVSQGTNPPLVEESSNNLYNYLIFQKAVPIVKVDGVLTTIGQTLIKTTGTTIVLDASLSRGTDVSKQFTIQKKDGFGNWVSALLTTDYTVVSGTETSSTFSISLVSASNFRIIFKAVGYNSSNNNFPVISDARDLITINEDTTNVIINATGTTGPVEVITLPQIESLLQYSNSISNSPITLYSGTNVVVTGNVLYDTGVWLVDSVEIPVSDESWLLELNSSVKVRLYVRNQSTGADVITPLNGLGPHNVSITTPGTYVFKFITSLT